MVTDVNVTLAGPVVIATAGTDGVLIAPGAIGNSGGNFTVLRDFNVLARSGRSSGGSTVALVIGSVGAAVAGIVALVVILAVIGSVGAAVAGIVALVVILAVIGSGCRSGFQGQDVVVDVVAQVVEQAVMVQALAGCGVSITGIRGPGFNALTINAAGEKWRCQFRSAPCCRQSDS